MDFEAKQHQAGEDANISAPDEVDDDDDDEALRDILDAWAASEWPVTIIKDRYEGTYSRGQWTAWPVEPEEVPPAVSDDDCLCSDWWAANRERMHLPVGVGDSPQAAVEALRIEVRQARAKDEAL